MAKSKERQEGGGGGIPGRVLGIILAGGKGSRLMPLTARRSKPAVAFAGGYRLIDFALSNLVNAGIEDVWIVEQYAPHSLNDHLAAGRPWDLDRTRGGLRILPPHEASKEADEEDTGFAGGNAEALAKHADAIEAFGPEIVVTLSADHVTNVDLRPLLALHRERGASVTMATKTMPEGEDVSRYSVVGVKAGVVTRFDYKPARPRGRTVAIEAFAYDAERLLRFLREHGNDSGDYGNKLLPQLVEEGRAYAVAHTGPWRDVGTVEAYWDAHMELLDAGSDLLNDPAWPIVTHPGEETVAEITATAEVRGAIVAPGAVVNGAVRRSVIGRNATIMPGARVENAVVLPGAVVHRGVTVRRAIVDEGFNLTQDLVARRGVLVAAEPVEEESKPAAPKEPAPPKEPARKAPEPKATQEKLPAKPKPELEPTPPKPAPKPRRAPKAVEPPPEPPKQAAPEAKPKARSLKVREEPGQ